MNTRKEMIKDHFLESIEVIKSSLELLEQVIEDATKSLVHSLKNGRKILSCGNGGSAADSQHFAAELINRFEIERPSLPAISLTTDTSNLTSIANDYSSELMFSKQISALGAKGDSLLAISTSGNSPSILKAVEIAQSKEMNIIALTGKDGGKLTKMLNSNDHEIRVNSSRTSRIQETHILIIHIFCSGIDAELFPDVI